MLDSINMYPDQDEMRRNISVFAPKESGGGGSANILAQFSCINPFLKLKFVAELEPSEEARLKIRLKEIQDQIKHSDSAKLLRKFKILHPLEMQLNRANLLRLQSRGALDEEEESEPSSDE